MLEEALARPWSKVFFLPGDALTLSARKATTGDGFHAEVYDSATNLNSLVITGD